MKFLGPEELVETRKKHNCCWCGDLIRPDNYAYTWAVKDGNVRRLYAHPECRQAIRRADVREWLEKRERGMTLDESHEHQKEIRDKPLMKERYFCTFQDPDIGRTKAVEAEHEANACCEFFRFAFLSEDWPFESEKAVISVQGKLFEVKISDHAHIDPDGNNDDYFPLVVNDAD